MLAVMNMSTGAIEDESDALDAEDALDAFGAFRDQVLKAEWVQRPDLRLGLQEIPGQSARSEKAITSRGMSAEAFLAAMYSNQR